MAEADVDSISVEIPDFVNPGGYGEDVSGQMSVQGTVGGAKAEEYNTLDEPIRHTILRDLKAVGNKFFHVLYPKEKKALLKEWDLWGPLVLCTFLAMGSQMQVPEEIPRGTRHPALKLTFTWKSTVLSKDGIVTTPSFERVGGMGQLLKPSRGAQCSRKKVGNPCFKGLYMSVVGNWGPDLAHEQPFTGYLAWLSYSQKKCTFDSVSTKLENVEKL